MRRNAINRLVFLNILPSLARPGTRKTTKKTINFDKKCKFRLTDVISRDSILVSEAVPKLQFWEQAHLLILSKIRLVQTSGLMEQALLIKGTFGNPGWVFRKEY
jgi:hypothetical protein